MLKVSKERIVHYTRVPEIAPSGTYSLHRMSSILFFQNNCIFHLNIVGTRQATIRNRITKGVWLEVNPSLLATLGPLSNSVIKS